MTRQTQEEMVTSPERMKQKNLVNRDQMKCKREQEKTTPEKDLKKIKMQGKRHRKELKQR